MQCEGGRGIIMNVKVRFGETSSIIRAEARVILLTIIRQDFLATNKQVLETECQD